MINLFVFIFYFFFILISVLGFGYFLKYYFKIDLENNCYGLIGLFGILFILIYSYATNLFFAHSKIHNFIFLFIGFIFFFYYNFFISKIDKKELYLSLAIFFTLLIGIFIFKAHDDFIYYHFPYAYYLTEQKLMIGIGQLLQGYRTPSSLFYFNSLLNLPFVDYYLFNFFPIYVLGFANIILLKKILVKKSEFKSNQSYIYYLSLIIFIFINIFFYRIAEHGTDRSAQILIFVLVVEILDQISKKNINFKFIYKIYFLLSIIISLKAFYFLYLVFLIPLLAKEFNYTKKMNILIGKFLLNKYFYTSNTQNI